MLVEPRSEGSRIPLALPRTRFCISWRFSSEVHVSRGSLARVARPADALREKSWHSFRGVAGVVHQKNLHLILGREHARHGTPNATPLRLLACLTDY